MTLSGLCWLSARVESSAVSSQHRGGQDTLGTAPYLPQPRIKRFPLFWLFWLTSRFFHAHFALLQKYCRRHFSRQEYAKARQKGFLFAILYESRPATLQNALSRQGRFCFCQHLYLFLFLRAILKSLACFETQSSVPFELWTFFSFRETKPNR